MGLDRGTEGDGKTFLPTKPLRLPGIESLPGLRIIMPQYHTVNKTSQEQGFYRARRRKKTINSFQKRAAKIIHEKDLNVSGSRDTPLPKMYTTRIMEKSTGSRNARLTAAISQSDVKDLLEVPNDYERRESMEVQVATSPRSSAWGITTEKGDISGHSLLSKVALETPTEGPDVHNVVLSDISETMISENNWPQWERDTSSDDVEEHFVGVIRRKSMSVVLPHVHEDTGNVDIGGIEITPGLYLRRRVKNLSKNDKQGIIAATENTTQNNDKTPDQGQKDEDSQRALVPPLYPPMNPAVRSRMKRWSIQETRLQFFNKDVTTREPAPVSVSRIVPFDGSLDTSRSTVDNMKSVRRYTAPKNSLLNDLSKSDDVNCVSQTSLQLFNRQDESKQVAPLSDRQPGVPFRVQERVRSKKASLKSKSYWDNMRKYINAVRKLQEQVSNSVDMFPLKGL